ncbi:MAG TPA: hypothetical protein VGN88_05270 [Phycisphaerae bacterium]
MTKVGFTWWGGLLGPKILNHVKCSKCGKTFNSKTGKSNDTAIMIYIVVSFVIVLGLLGCLGIGAFIAALKH